jgi:hypothetical protein
MKILQCDRSVIYAVLNALFGTLGIQPRVAELGVLKGENAEKILATLNPIDMYLVDAWSSLQCIQDYDECNSHRNWISRPDEFQKYYGGSLYEQATFDRLYEGVVNRFQARANVIILRKSSLGALDLLTKNPGSEFHLVYVDANHSYEGVLDDLMGYKDLLHEDFGFFQLNDCCHSDAGVRQNLGVLEAAVKFCKMQDFSPLLLSNTDWTDVLFVRRGSKSVSLIDQIILSSNIPFVEVPDQLLGAMRVRYGSGRNLSFM